LGPLWAESIAGPWCITASTSYLFGFWDWNFTYHIPLY